MKPKRQEETVSVKVIAILGPTASGKSALAISLALKHDALIFSLDSLAVYKELDIASAKPSIQEQAGIRHFGIDELCIDQPFNVTDVARLYKEALEEAKELKKPLIIVGGSSFYLKSLLTGLSTLPSYTKETIEATKKQLEDLPSAFAFLASVDPLSAQSIAPNDKYRLEKLLLLYKQTKTAPSLYFKEHPPQPLIEAMPIFTITMEKELLHERIGKRTKIMIENGLIDEIAKAEKKYGRAHQSMKAIGVIEVLEYLDAKLTRQELIEKIAHNTRQLAKRQTTFNQSQFEDAVFGSAKELEEKIEILLKAKP